MNRQRKFVSETDPQAQPSPGKLKATIENHPLAVLAGVVIAAATLTAGVIGWFWKESDHLQDIQFKTELSSTSAKFEAKISDLSLRLASIERRVGDTKLYLDVLRIPITASDVNALPASYSSFDSGYFFVSVPASGTWTGSAATQLDVAISMFGDSARKMVDAVGQALPVTVKYKGFLWKSSEVITSQLAPSAFTQMLGNDKFQFHPYLFIMGIDQAYVNDALKQIKGIFAEKPPEAAEIAKSIAVLDQLRTADGGKDKNASATNAAPLAAAKNEVLQKSDLEQGVLDALSATSREDLAGFLLVDALLSRLQLSTFAGGSLKVVATQKKGNVWYLRTQMVLPTASMQGDKAVTAQVILDEEFFFIGTTRGGVLVRSGVPSLALRSDAYAWTSSLLSSLRVTVD
ncbi:MULTISPECIES: hypothetical protein [unclassified Caballeronia]|uniref:hypothetical protein n=1 Tax=unclassified Caballeronia TaxID=2646786 RepID=UPI0028677197|nr:MULTISPECIES: hypothetical protein [unclassified Caballeronia]MDR5749995.1 hypothetical protein [Caballeronia sp. LZ024]MDR5842877.1 hypothetical protein [Caballeronia sp. LZ031]